MIFVKSDSMTLSFYMKPVSQILEDSYRGAPLVGNLKNYWTAHVIIASSFIDYF